MTTTNTYLQGQKAFLSGDLEDSIKAFSDALEQGLPLPLPSLAGTNHDFSPQCHS